MSFGIGHSGSSTDSTLAQLISQMFSQSTTGTSSGSQTQSGTNNSETTKVLTPEQLSAQGTISKVISALSSNPHQFFAPAQNQARNNVNSDFSGTADTLRQQFMGGTGGGGSGKYGSSALRSDIARRGQLASVDSNFAQAEAAAPLTAAGLAQNLLGTDMGSKTKGVVDTSGKTVQTGTSDTKGTNSGSTVGVSTGNTSSGGFNIGL